MEKKKEENHIFGLSVSGAITCVIVYCVCHNTYTITTHPVDQSSANQFAIHSNGRRILQPSPRWIGVYS
jgi:hypothetical protein